MIRFACPACRMTVQAPDDLGGTVAACPRCGSLVGVPNPVPGTAPAAKEAEPIDVYIAPPPMDVLPADEEPMDVLPADQRKRPRRPPRREDAGPEYDPYARFMGRGPGFWTTNRVWGVVGIVLSLLFLIPILATGLRPVSGMSYTAQCSIIGGLVGLLIGGVVGLVVG
jgi:hypothetical protein